jgi:PKD repeat protein/DNA-binding beta-propeller fold protein YncE
MLAGQVVVTATDFLSPSVYGTAVVTFTGGVPISLTLVAYPTNQGVGGTSLLTATLRDTYGNPSPGYTINFTTTDPLGLGGLAPLSGVTSAAGEATSGISSTLTGVKTITATGGGLTATAQVTFSIGTLATIVVTPNPVTVAVGATQPFTATGYDGFGNPVPVTPAWTTDGGAAAPGPGATTVFTAQTTAAAGRLITATEGAVSGTAVITIVPGSATAIDLTPVAATIAAGQSQAYTVTARDTYSNTWDVTALAAYTITPGAGGAWLVNVYTAQVAGSWTVSATYLSLADTAALTVTHAPTATGALLSPNPYTVGAGGAVAYTLVATDTYGNGWDATASGAYTITPGAGGAWLANVYTSQYTGTWIVTATVPSATATAVLSVTQLPAASFTRVPTGTVCVNATVQFTDTSSGGPTAWLWDFGDSVTTTVQHPAHVYTAANTYTVTLGASNIYGSSAASGTVEVIAAPAASITRAPAGNVCVGTSIAFTATNTGGPATVLWDFGDTVTATGQTAAHAYAAPGSYTVWLTATNGCGTSVVSATVTANAGPAASFVRDPAGDVILGVTIQFTDTSSGGPASWLWDFGDGVTATLQHPTHAYTATGTYSVTLSASNGCGASNITGTVNVIAGCVPPTITSLISNSPITQGQTMVLTATVAGSIPITTTWNYGDGTPPLSGVGLVTASHVYSTSGVFTVTLAVTNSCGSAGGLLPVTVAGVTGAPDHIVLVAVPSSLPVSNTATLTATVYDVFNVPLAGQVITFTTPDPLGVGSLTPVTATTNAQGQAIATISSTVAGVKRVTALAYNLVSASTNVTFISGYAVYLPLVLRDYTSPIGRITLVAYPLAATVGQTVVLTATVTNPDGSPAAGVTVQFVMTSTLTGVVLSPPSATTNGSGQAMATLTSASVGVVQVTAQATGYGSDSAYVYFRLLSTCAPQVIAAIPTGPSPREIAHHAAGHRAFVAHENGVTVIDTQTFAVITDVHSFTGGYGIAYDFERNRIWVSLWSSDRVVVLDGTTYATLASLPTGAWPHSVEYNPTNDRIYVANIVASTVSVYDAASLVLERTLANFAGPTHMVVNPATNKIYVVNHNLYGNITVIDGSTHATHRINTDLFDAYDVAVDWDRNLIYAASLGEGRISIINGATDTVSDCLHIRPVDPPLRHLWLYTIGINPSVGPGGTPHLLVANHNAEDGSSRLLLLPLQAGGWLAQGSHPVRLDVAPYPHNGLLVDTDTEQVWLTGLESDMVTVVQDGPTTCATWDEVYVDLCSNYFNP